MSAHVNIQLHTHKTKVLTSMSLCLLLDMLLNVVYFSAVCGLLPFGPSDGNPVEPD